MQLIIDSGVYLCVLTYLFLLHYTGPVSATANFSPVYPGLF